MQKQTMMNRVVVVTGAASGIGAAICAEFGKHGAKIALIDVDEQNLEARKRELIALNIDSFAWKCDVSMTDQCQAVMRQVISHYGGIDVLVNNAGITQRCAFVDAQISMYRKVMDVNFFGALNCTAPAIESLIKRQGTIVVTSSIAGLTPVLGRTGYCASKHALHGFFSTLRAELKKHGVHVLIVCPGFTSTNLQIRALGGDGSVTSHPQSRIGEQALPEDVAGAIYRSVLKRKSLLVLTPIGKISYLFHKFAPGLYERVMARQLQGEIEG